MDNICFPKSKFFPLRVKMELGLLLTVYPYTLTLLHSERPKLYAILAFLSAIGLNTDGHTIFVKIFASMKP